MQTLPIVGARFRPPAEDVLRLLPANAPLLLRRQPENPHDENAVQVILTAEAANEEGDVNGGLYAVLDLEGMFGQDIHLGFIPREAAQQLAIVMDEWAEADLGATENFGPCEWPATLTFSATGRAMVSFAVPTTEIQDEKPTEC